MASEKWQTPVEIDFGNSGPGTVSGPFEAIAFLTEGWPKKTGLQALKARSKCRAAIAGRGSLEDARAEFAAAVQEASLSRH